MARTNFTFEKRRKELEKKKKKEAKQQAKQEKKSQAAETDPATVTGDGTEPEAEPGIIP